MRQESAARLLALSVLQESVCCRICWTRRQPTASQSLLQRSRSHLAHLPRLRTQRAPTTSTDRLLPKDVRHGTVKCRSVCAWPVPERPASSSLRTAAAWPTALAKRGSCSAARALVQCSVRVFPAKVQLLLVARHHRRVPGVQRPAGVVRHCQHIRCQRWHACKAADTAFTARRTGTSGRAQRAHQCTGRGECTRAALPPPSLPVSWQHTPRSAAHRTSDLRAQVRATEGATKQVGQLGRAHHRPVPLKLCPYLLRLQAQRHRVRCFYDSAAPLTSARHAPRQQRRLAEWPSSSGASESAGTSAAPAPSAAA